MSESVRCVGVCVCVYKPDSRMIGHDETRVWGGVKMRVYKVVVFISSHTDLSLGNRKDGSVEVIEAVGSVSGKL